MNVAVMLCPHFIIELPVFSSTTHCLPARTFVFTVEQVSSCLGLAVPCKPRPTASVGHLASDLSGLALDAAMGCVAYRAVAYLQYFHPENAGGGVLSLVPRMAQAKRRNVLFFFFLPTLEELLLHSSRTGTCTSFAASHHRVPHEVPARQPQRATAGARTPTCCCSRGRRADDAVRWS